MKKTILSIALISILASCTSDADFDNGKRQLEMMGYIEVKNTGYNMFCCADKETYSTGFSAVDKNGNTVKGCFCSSITKGVTVRFE